jgi:hypothetical protein
MDEHTICTAVAPDDIFTIRTYGHWATLRLDDPGWCANHTLQEHKPAGQPPQGLRRSMIVIKVGSLAVFGLRLTPAGDWQDTGAKPAGMGPARAVLARHHLAVPKRQAEGW